MKNKIIKSELTINDAVKQIIDIVSAHLNSGSNSKSIGIMPDGNVGYHFLNDNNLFRNSVKIEVQNTEKLDSIFPNSDGRGDFDAEMIDYLTHIYTSKLECIGDKYIEFKKDKI